MVPMPDQTPLPFPDKPGDDKLDDGAPGLDKRAPDKPASAEADRARMTLTDAMTPPADDATDPARSADIAADAAPPSASDAAPPTPRSPIVRRPAPVARSPWWAHLLGKLMAPWVSLTIEPKVPAEHALGSPGRPVCYVLEDYGLSNALILERACREAGLP